MSDAGRDGPGRAGVEGQRQPRDAHGYGMSALLTTASLIRVEAPQRGEVVPRRPHSVGGDSRRARCYAAAYMRGREADSCTASSRGSSRGDLRAFGESSKERTMAMVKKDRRKREEGEGRGPGDGGRWPAEVVADTYWDLIDLRIRRRRRAISHHHCSCNDASCGVGRSGS